MGGVLLRHIVGLLTWLQALRAPWRTQRVEPDIGTRALDTAVGPSLAQPLQACATVVIHACDESACIANMVREAWSDPATAEVIVIDDGSIDDTAAQARRTDARVLTSSMLGRGASMRDGLDQAQCELLVFLDGDQSANCPGIVSNLCRPLVRGDADFVKARTGRTGDRVSELTAKPMLMVFFPMLAALAQPVSGAVAARRSVLKALQFEDGCGVDVGLLIDAHRAGARVVEVDIDTKPTEIEPPTDQTALANEVSRVIYTRAKAAGRLHVEKLDTMYESQRQATSAIEYILSRRRGRSRLLLLGMDGTLTHQTFVQAMARASDVETELNEILMTSDDDPAASRERIARLFRSTLRQQFEAVARAMEIRPGVLSCVNLMRRSGFMVGVVSDSYLVAAEVMRRRIFADFAMAHKLHFEAEVCTGQFHPHPAFLPRTAGELPVPCKSHVVRRFRDDPAAPLLEQVWAVGDNVNDLGMLLLADRGFVIDPKSSEMMRHPGLVRIHSFEELMGAVSQPAINAAQS